jgi:hypothetical protein
VSVPILGFLEGAKKAVIKSSNLPGEENKARLDIITAWYKTSSMLMSYHEEESKESRRRTEFVVQSVQDAKSLGAHIT